MNKKQLEEYKKSLIALTNIKKQQQAKITKLKKSIVRKK